MIEDDILTRHCTVLGTFVAQCQPKIWGNRSQMLTHEWFKWPPDIFALTSLLLKRTGAYRRAASPENEEWPQTGWPEEAREKANDWRNWIADGARGKHPLSKEIQELEACTEHRLDDLYDPKNEDEWKLCRLLLRLHGIADEAMRGAGIVFSPWTSLQMDSGEKKSISKKISFFYLQANFMLALRGSLSRIPKYLGTVLPKTRTPQVGLTIRSFSLNLTFHNTEVDVAWRAFPWLNFDENIINVLAVPWPFEVKASFFEPLYHPKTSSQLGHNRYFHYQPKPEERLDSKRLVKVIEEASQEVRRIHIMIFPEMALRPRELRELKNDLEEGLAPSQIPMIVTGISAQFTPQDPTEEAESGANPEAPAVAKRELDSQTAKKIMAGPQAAGFNRVVLSVYYAGKWHDVIQDKHHRWKVDGKQIEQYGLGGVLSGGRTWWEAIHVTRRRLSVLAASSWLTICPLICEDLARLDPVSEVLRGVGPTLLTAILLDGPQLRSRWSARYASVFADDPGSSVLTLTSLGMSSRSIRPEALDAVSQKEARELSRTIGLWKDQEKGWRPISIDRSGYPAKVLTINALCRSETTFDGRSDFENSAVFRYQGSFQPPQPRCDETPPSTLEDSGHQLVSSAAGIVTTKEEGENTELPSKGEQEREDVRERKEEDATKKKLKILDMCELTLFTYYADAIVDPESQPEDLFSWFKMAVGLGDGGVKAGERPSNLPEELADILVYSIKTRDLVPRELPTPHLVMAIEAVNSIVRTAHEEFERKYPGKKRWSAEMLTPYLKVLETLAWEQVEAVGFRMRTDLASPEGTQGEFEREVLTVAGKINRESKEKANGSKELPLDFNPHEVGRIRMMTPISILWAIHSRLTTRRRFGLLDSKEASLLEAIEGKVYDRDNHRTYTAWRERIKASQA